MTTAIRKPALPMPTRRANEIKNKLLHMLDEERTRKKKKNTSRSWFETPWNIII